MAGELYGAFFKSVVNALLMSDVLFPDIRARIDSMDDDGWYSWDEYCAIVNRIADTLQPLSMRKCGVNLMVQSAEFYYSMGYHKMADHMHRFSEGFNNSVRNAPAQDRVEVLETGPQSVKLIFGAIQPRYLCEGYIRGGAKIYNARILALDYERVNLDGHDYHQFSVRWRDLEPSSESLNVAADSERD